MDVPEDLDINGLLGVYELNRIELMMDVFVSTDERSYDRYQVVRHTGEPDTFRLRPTEFKDWQKRKTYWPPTLDLSINQYPSLTSQQAEILG